MRSTENIPGIAVGGMGEGHNINNLKYAEYIFLDENGIKITPHL